jgi:hypothetical protein
MESSLNRGAVHGGDPPGPYRALPRLMTSVRPVSSAQRAGQANGRASATRAGDAGQSGLIRTSMNTPIGDLGTLKYLPHLV